MYSTRLTVVDSGAEQRVSLWSHGRLSFEIGYTANPVDFSVIIAFFRARKGRAFGFRFKDWSDYKAVNEPIGSGTSGQLLKTYTDAGGSEVRRITKPVDGSVIIKNSLAATMTFTLDVTTGLYTITSPTSPPYTWSGQFDVPVRFDVDKLSFVQDSIGSRTLQSLPIVEVLI